MKNTIGLLVLCLFATVFSAQAQQGQGQRRTPEDRVKMTMDKVKPALGLDDNQSTQANSAFLSYYQGMEKIRAAMQPGTRPDRTQFDKLTADRDEQLKKVFTADQFKKFKDEVEPSMRPQRGGGGGGGNRPAGGNPQTGN